MAWLTNWNYRKSITISNSGSALTDYQVQITIDTATLVTAAKMLSTCNDIRFTSSDGSTLINYWIESGRNTSSTKILVKIPSIPATPTTETIYIYYGNSSATSASDGANTFVFFAGFESGMDGFSAGTRTTAKSTEGAYSLIYATNPYSISPIISFPTSFIVEMDMWFPSGVYSEIHYHAFNKYLAFGIGYPNPGTWGYLHAAPGDWTNTGVSVATGNWNTIKLLYNSTANTYSGWQGSTQFLNAGTVYSSLSTDYIKLLSVTGTSYVDAIRVRKYASPEPTLSSIGIEEILAPANITATDMTLTPSENPCRQGICTISVSVTWTNTGEVSGTFVPNISIDGTPASPIYSSELLGPWATTTHGFTVSGLSVGTRSICPDPN